MVDIEWDPKPDDDEVFKNMRHFHGGSGDVNQLLSWDQGTVKLNPKALKTLFFEHQIYENQYTSARLEILREMIDVEHTVSVDLIHSKINETTGESTKTPAKSTIRGHLKTLKEIDWVEMEGQNRYRYCGPELPKPEGHAKVTDEEEPD